MHIVKCSQTDSLVIVETFFLRMLMEVRVLKSSHGFDGFVVLA